MNSGFIDELCEAQARGKLQSPELEWYISLNGGSSWMNPSFPLPHSTNIVASITWTIIFLTAFSRLAAVTVTAPRSVSSVLVACSFLTRRLLYGHGMNGGLSIVNLELRWIAIDILYFTVHVIGETAVSKRLRLNVLDIIPVVLLLHSHVQYHHLLKKSLTMGHNRRRKNIAGNIE